MTCPHCGSTKLDPGATGLDMCQRCGGLSRKGSPLARRQPFEMWADAPVLATDLHAIYADGIIVTSLIVDGQPAIAVTYRVGGDTLPPFVVSGDQARDLVRLATDALTAAERTSN